MIMKRLHICLFGILAILSSCAKTADVPLNEQKRQYLEDWIKRYPDAKQEKGCYILEDIPGDGAEYDASGSGYVFVNTIVRRLDGTVLSNSDEQMAMQLLGKDFSEADYYGPRALAIGEGSSYAGFDMMLGGMNSGHAKMADWGLSHLSGVTAENIAELGCGGGRNAGELLKRYPDSKLVAIDYSELSVEKSKAYNDKMIKQGRCVVKQSNVSALDLPDGSFDLATAFETVYFWPGIEKCFAEVCRVLKSGGVFMICNESDGTDETSLKFEKIIDGMKCYTAKELSVALKSAGFTSVKTDHHTSKPWITVVAVK